MTTSSLLPVPWMLTAELVGQAKGWKEAEAVPAAVFVPVLKYRIQMLHRRVVQEIVSG